uniref:Uncharacterized protein n=1 Tax=Setaria digitata TaxID=48799 RepID=A0A915Q0E9_9BILA
MRKGEGVGDGGSGDGGGGGGAAERRRNTGHDQMTIADVKPDWNIDRCTLPDKAKYPTRPDLTALHRTAPHLTPPYPRATFHPQHSNRNPSKLRKQYYRILIRSTHSLHIGYSQGYMISSTTVQPDHEMDWRESL